MSKLENPVRLKELNPSETLKSIGLKKDDVFCDIGAGTGIFTVEAAKITEAVTYAIDISDDMLKTIAKKAKEQELQNIELINPDGFSYPISSEKCDYVFMCTFLHEIDEKQALLLETKRILKSQGRLVIIEFHKRQTPFGPPEPHRISSNQTTGLLANFGFTQLKCSNLGDNFYISEFIKNNSIE